MINIFAVNLYNAISDLIGKYVYANLVRPAYKLDNGKDYISPDSIEGLELVVKPLGVVGVDGLLNGARVRYQADIYLKQHDIEGTTDDATELIISEASAQGFKVIDVVPTKRNLALDSIEQTRIRIEYTRITTRSIANGYVS